MKNLAYELAKQYNHVIHDILQKLWELIGHPNFFVFGCNRETKTWFHSLTGVRQRDTLTFSLLYLMCVVGQSQAAGREDAGII